MTDFKWFSQQFSRDQTRFTCPSCGGIHRSRGVMPHPQLPSIQFPQLMSWVGLIKLNDLLVERIGFGASSLLIWFHNLGRDF